jgi:hypothetical protein
MSPATVARFIQNQCDLAEHLCRLQEGKIPTGLQHLHQTDRLRAGTDGIGMRVVDLGHQRKIRREAGRHGLRRSRQPGWPGVRAVETIPKADGQDVSIRRAIVRQLGFAKNAVAQSLEELQAGRVLGSVAGRGGSGFL